MKKFIFICLVILVGLNFFLTNSRIIAENKPCSPGIYCNTLVREVCIDNCGGRRKCKNYTLLESYCETCSCYSRWLVECTTPWDWFYYHCNEFKQICCP